MCVQKQVQGRPTYATKGSEAKNPLPVNDQNTSFDAELLYLTKSQ